VGDHSLEAVSTPIFQELVEVGFTKRALDCDVDTVLKGSKAGVLKVTDEECSYRTMRFLGTIIVSRKLWQ